nr:MAG TPA: hypothetical protein [Caudoviricetes sp.]
MSFGCQFYLKKSRNPHICLVSGLSFTTRIQS